MYKCKICGVQSEEGEPMSRKVTRKKLKDKGWEIAEEKDCCISCFKQ